MIICTDVLTYGYWSTYERCYLTCTCVQNGATPVYIAAQKGHVGALKALISAGANFNAANVVSIECVNFFTYCLCYTAFGIQIRGRVQKYML